MTAPAPLDLTALLDDLERAHAAATPRPTPIPSAPGYGATADGRVWSLASDWRGYGVRPLIPDVDRYGYAKVRMVVDGRRVRRTVHGLVLGTLGEPRPSSAHQVRHLNGDKTDNRLVNLAWGTAQENAEDREAHGTTARGERSGTARLSREQVDEMRRRHAAGEMQKDLAREFGIGRQHISDLIHHRAWAHTALTAALSPESVPS